MRSARHHGTPLSAESTNRAYHDPQVHPMKPEGSSSAAHAHQRGYCDRCDQKWSMCGCARVTLSREERNQKIQAIVAQTDFSRAKAMSTKAGLLQSEAARRDAIARCWDLGLREIACSFECEFCVVACIQDECDERRFLVRERAKWLKLQRCERRRDEELAGLAAEETEWRRFAVGDELLEREWLEDRVFRLMRVAEFAEAAVHRCVVIASEASEDWARLLTHETDARLMLTRAGRQRKELFDAEWAMRDELIADEADCYANGMRCFDELLAFLVACADEQQEVCVCEASGRGAVEVDALTSWMALVADMQEQEAALSQRRRALLGLLAEADAEHDESRLALEQHEMRRREEVTLRIAEDRAETDAVTAKKTRRREQAYEYVRAIVDKIADEEGREFADLHAWFVEEHELRLQWIAERRAERNRFRGAVWDAVTTLLDVALDEYRYIRDKMLEDEELVRRWIDDKATRRARALERATAGLLDLFAEEDDARCAVYECMSGAEEALIAWLDELGEQRSGAAVDEMLHRRAVEEAEGAARDAMYAACSDREAAVGKYLDQLAAERLDVARRLYTRLQDISAEEQRHFDALLTLADQEVVVCVAEAHCRERNEFDQFECAERRVVVQVELREREAIRTQLGYVLQMLSRRFRDLWESVLLELDHEEYRARELMLREFCEELAAAGCHERQAREVAEAAARDRHAHELLEWQAYLLEDARQYTDEEPYTEGRESLIYARESAGRIPPAEEDAHKRFYISEQLEGIDVACMPDNAVEIVALLLERSTVAVEAAQAAREAARKAHGDLKARIEKARAEVRGVKEREAFYKTKLERDANDFEAKKRSQKVLLGTAQQNQRAEQRRFDEVQHELQQQKNRNDATRAALHKAMSRR